MFCICVKKPLPPGDNLIAVNKYYYYYYYYYKGYSNTVTKLFSNYSMYPPAVTNFYSLGSSFFTLMQMPG
jgi:hypothetical protein